MNKTHEPKLVELPVFAKGYRAQCNHCETGEMLFLHNDAPGSFIHKCNSCGALETYKNQFPAVVLHPADLPKETAEGKTD